MFGPTDLILTVGVSVNYWVECLREGCREQGGITTKIESNKTIRGNLPDRNGPLVPIPQTTCQRLSNWILCAL